MREIRCPAVLLAIGTTLALALAACGDEQDSREATTQAETTAAAPGAKTRTIAVSESDFALAPKDLEVKAGRTVSFDVRNHGSTIHSLEIEGPEGESELEEELDPGDAGQLEVTFSKPGTYAWYCPIGDHREMGMEGTITVRSGRKAG